MLSGAKVKKSGALYGRTLTEMVIGGSLLVGETEEVEKKNIPPQWMSAEKGNVT